MAAPADHSPVGRHVLAELDGCPPGLLDKPDLLDALFQRAARECGATVVGSHFHHFSPTGVSGVVLIAESHITVHTWPEHGYAAIDVFTCGDTFLADEIAARLTRDLGAGSHRIRAFERAPGPLAPLVPRA